MRSRAAVSSCVLVVLAACADGRQRDASVPFDEFDATARPPVEAGVPRDVEMATDTAPRRDPDMSPLFDGDARCGANYREYDAYPGMHVPTGTVVNWSTNPPSSGDHYAIWATYGVHRNVLDRRYYVHNEEHGAVVVLYRCDGDCTELRNQLEEFVTHFPPETACIGRGGVPRRILITPDPLLDTPVAAAAWGWVYRASCFDADSLDAFVRRRTGYGPEDNCEDGLVD